MTLFTIIKKIIKTPTALVGLILLLAFAAIAIWAPVLAPVPENSIDEQFIPQDGLSSTPKPPNEDHKFGTLAGQYDIFYGVVWGTRTAFRIGLGVALITSTVGLILGSISAFFGGWVDEIIMRITDVFQSMPFILPAIILTSVLQFVYERGEGGILIVVSKLLALITFGNSYLRPIISTKLPILFGMIAIIMFGWMEIARVIRGNILAVKNSEYAQAALTIGAKDFRILFRHLLPNAFLPLLVVTPMQIGSYVLTFATLSFLGLGAQEGYADWGQMLNLSRNWLLSLADYPYIAVYPGAAIILFVLAWSLLGDGLQDILDPRLNGKH
jgi:peptide/nickel transport system permease protein